jgi:TolA-binding protein
MKSVIEQAINKNEGHCIEKRIKNTNRKIESRFEKAIYKQTLSSNCGVVHPRKIAAILCILITAATIFTMATYASGAGTTGDPIALKSYVDLKLSDLEKKLVAMLNGSALPVGNGAGSNSAVGMDQNNRNNSSSVNGATATLDQKTSADITALSMQVDKLTRSLEKLTEENAMLKQSIIQLTESGSSLANGSLRGADGTASNNNGSGSGSGGLDSRSDFNTSDNIDSSDIYKDFLSDSSTFNENEISNASRSGVAGSVSSTSRFTAMELKTHQKIILGAGTEIVLRTGKAMSIRGEFGSLVDLISGKDLDAGENVTRNHIILSPRNDNRGMKFTEDSWILVKGQYELR